MEIFQQYTNIIHISCLPLNRNFSFHIKDTVAKKSSPDLYLVGTPFLHLNLFNWCQISSEIATWQD